MRIFMDTANIDDIRRGVAMGVVDGVTTNPSLHRRIVHWAPFRTGQYDTKSLERDLMGGA